MSKEIWRRIPSQPELMASSWGRIKILPYEAPMPEGHGVRIYFGRPTKGVWAKDQKRYLFCRKGRKTLKVAHLVCEAFKGPSPKHLKRPVCMHSNENSRNNTPGNLKWGTQKQNLNAPGFLAYCASRTGSNSPCIKGRR